MIFSHIEDIKGAQSKKFYLEKINLMIRIVEEYCAFHHISLEEHETILEQALSELQDAGILHEEKDLKLLKKLTASDFERFLRILSFYHEHKEQSGYILRKFYNSYRKHVQEQAAQDTVAPRIADFFAGAGGLSIGFEQEGFIIELANEIDEVCAETYKFNHPNVHSSKIINDDIKNIMDDLGNRFVDRPIDVVIGGPPCQSFSPANQQRIIDDPRNVLYKYFVQAVEKIKPKFVVMENVKGMLSVADQVVEDFHQITVEINGETVDYKVEYQLFNAHDFSVAQNRERLIYIGVRSDIKHLLNLTPGKIIEDIMAYTEGKPRFVLQDALACIKPLKACEVMNMTETDCEESGKKVDRNHFYDQSNSYLDLVNNGKRFPVITNHKARFCNEINMEIYARLDQGEDSTSEKIKDIMPYQHRSHIFKDKYFKLVADKPSRTITAHLRMDCHSHIHPHQVRSITPREAARIQSFPDDYIFLGPYLKTYMQIGNAVPPMMARGFANVIKRYLEAIKEKQNMQLQLL